MAYTLPPLPYDYAALEPFIDAETMHLHHDKHHQAYINNVNAALEKHPDLAAKSVDDLLRGLAEVPEDITAPCATTVAATRITAFLDLMAPGGLAAWAARPLGLSPRDRRRLRRL